KIDVDKKRLIEGHIGDTRGKSYTGREWDDLREFYSTAYPQIDVDAGDPELEEKISNWQEEKRHLTERVYQLEEEKRGRESDVGQMKKLTGLMLKLLITPPKERPEFFTFDSLGLRY